MEWIEDIQVKRQWQALANSPFFLMRGIEFLVQLLKKDYTQRPRNYVGGGGRGAQKKYFM
jgi:hypothetical protein